MGNTEREVRSINVISNISYYLSISICKNCSAYLLKNIMDNIRYLLDYDKFHILAQTLSSKDLLVCSLFISY